MNNLEQMKILRESMERLDEGRYWDNTGKFEKEAQELQKLVPPSGPAKTIKGEIMRAASKIYYDYHNNGFGNHWPGPAAFLMNLVAFDDDVKEMLYMHAMGNMGDGIDGTVEKMMDTVVDQLRDMPDQKNTVDMWDTEYHDSDFEPEQSEDPWEDDPEDEYDDQEDDDYWRARD